MSGVLLCGGKAVVKGDTLKYRGYEIRAVENPDTLGLEYLSYEKGRMIVWEESYLIANASKLKRKG